MIVNHVKDPSLNCRYRGGEALTAHDGQAGKPRERRGGGQIRWAPVVCDLSRAIQWPAGDMATDLRKHRVPSSTEGAYFPR